MKGLRTRAVPSHPTDVCPMLGKNICHKFVVVVWFLILHVHELRFLCPVFVALLFFLFLCSFLLWTRNHHLDVLTKRRQQSNLQSKMLTRTPEWVLVILVSNYIWNNMKKNKPDKTQSTHNGVVLHTSHMPMTWAMRWSAARIITYMFWQKRRWWSSLQSEIVTRTAEWALVILVSNYIYIYIYIFKKHI